MDDEIREEAGVGSAGGSTLVWPTHVPALAPFYGDDAIAHHLRQGGHVYRRRVIIVEDWEPVEYTGQRCANAECLTCAREPRRHG